MTGLSALTFVKNRAAHLRHLLEGLCRSATPPSELVIVDMDATPPALPEARFPVRRLHIPMPGLPLAQARNLAAAAAHFDCLLFLDADCIPMSNLAGAMQRHLAEDALICAEIRYLGPHDAGGAWDETELRQTASPHPVRAFPEHGLARCDNPGLFWSLAFGIRRSRFQELGGFNEAFTGYGAEDTDFGFRAHRGNLPLLFLGGVQAGIGAFHQHHPVHHPPLQHFADIVRNAQLFHARWQVWPMQGWLGDFEKMGLLTIHEHSIEILRDPTSEELNNARSADARF